MRLPDGTDWKLVPAEADENMARPGYDKIIPEDIWAVMLAAAPQPPIEEIAAEIAEIISVAQVMGNASIADVARAIVKRLIDRE